MTSVRNATSDDSDALGLITVSASLGTFIGHIPETDLDLTWKPQDSAAVWRTTLSELAADQFLLVAEDGTDVAGFVWAGLSEFENREHGEIKGLYVLPTMQSKGLGRVLLGEAAARLKKQGISSLLIGCIKENPSCGFYRHLGGIERFRRPNQVDRYQTEEIFFHWEDLAGLTH